MELQNKIKVNNNENRNKVKINKIRNKKTIINWN